MRTRFEVGTDCGLGIIMIFNELRYFFRHFLGHVHEMHLGISEFDITIAFSLYSEKSK